MATAELLQMSDKKSADKQKALDSALAQIERQFGKGSIMTLGGNAVQEIEATSTGSLGLDIALGIGGIPKGRIVEIYGPESSGKTTLTLHCVAEEQKKGGVCAFVDAEHALDPGYAKKLGVNLDELLISQPDTGEQALEIVDTLVRSGAVSMIVVDSRTRRRYGRQFCWRPRASDVPSHAQIDGFYQPNQLHCGVYQPNSHENWRDVRFPRNHHWRQRVEILLLRPPRHPPYRRTQGPR